ncbi:MAG TPA: AMP-binding protein, partial [Glaciihabitans sp.]|nr:AMP-binding protein [Glaciihabitans sp.]
MITSADVSEPLAGILSAGHLASEPRTLLDIVRASTLQHPEASALDDAQGALSYRELMARVIQTAARLNEAGVRRGDRVGVRMPSGSRELYIAILGIMAAGAAYVPVDADDPDERADLVFSEAAVRGVITGAGVYQPSLTEASPVTSGVQLFAGSAPHPSTSSLPIVHAPEPTDDAWVIFTSGSTGTPKG